MNARISLALAALACVVAGPAQAQVAKTRITVMTFQSPEKGTGAKAADDLRGRLSKQFNVKDVYVLPTKDVNNTLEQSGFSASDPLAGNDEKALANLLRADAYVTGSIAKEPTGAYRVDARLTLSRDNVLSQALPPATSNKIGDAMDNVAKSVKNALGQLENEQTCVNKARSGDVAGALAAARKGIADNPQQSTLVRLCAANVFYQQYAKAASHADSVRLADSVLTFTQQIVQQDPRSVAALRLNAELYKVTGDSARARQTLVELIRADPSNDRLITQVVNELAGSGHAQDAVPLVQELLQRSPGDPQMLRTAFLVYLAANDWQQAVATGPELIRADTAAADTSYYLRMAAAYTNLNQPQQAIAALQAGTTRFPNNSGLLLAYASALRKNGQAAQAADVLKRALAANPNNPQVLLLLADSYAQSNQVDSVAAVLQRGAVLPGADKATYAQYALSKGQELFKAATASKDRAQFQAAIRLFQLSDRIQPSADAKFLAGYSAFSIAQSAYNEANTAKSCQLAQLASENLAVAQTGLEAGATDDKYKGPASQLLPYVSKFRPAAAAQVKKFCR